MKSSTLVILLVGFVAYMWLSQKPNVVPYNDRSQNPTGGTTNTQPDVFSSILGAVTAVANTVGTLAKTQPSTT